MARHPVLHLTLLVKSGSLRKDPSKKEVSMAGKFVGERNLRFLLYEVFDVDSLCRYPYYQEHSERPST